MGLISVDGYEPKHLSFSTISGYRMCGTKFYLEKIAQAEQRPGLAALAGNAIHTATEHVDMLIWEGGFEALDEPASPTLDTHDTAPSTIPTRAECGF